MTTVSTQPPEAVDAPHAWPFIPEVVSAASTRCGLFDSPVTAEALARAVDPHEWARVPPESRDLAFFHKWSWRESPTAVETDGSVAHHLLRPHARRSQACDQEARLQGHFLDISDPKTATAARWLLALSDPEESSFPLSIAALTQARSLADTYQYASAVGIMTEPDRLSLLPPAHPDTFEVRRLVADWLGEMGRVFDAIDRLRVLTADLAKVTGARQPAVLVVRGDLARWTGEAGQHTEAIKQSRGLLDDARETYGQNHLFTRSMRLHFAHWLGHAGHLREAIELLRNTLATAIGLGDDHAAVLDIRAHLARWLGESGALNESIEQNEALLRDQVLLHGPDHISVLTTRNNLGLGHLRAGRVTTASHLLADLVRDLERLLGRDHPKTLTSRHNLALSLAEAGRLREATDQLAALLSDETRVLGSDHPSTIRTRDSIAGVLREAGRTRVAARSGHQC